MVMHAWIGFGGFVLCFFGVTAAWEIATRALMQARQEENPIDKAREVLLAGALISVLLLCMTAGIGALVSLW